MKIGFKLRLVSGTRFDTFAFAKKATVIPLMISTICSTQAAELPVLEWENRDVVEKADGDYTETPPFVSVNGVRLKRFSQMQLIALEELVYIEDSDEPEKLYVFRVWQGGASQGEQLMLVSLSQGGLIVIGPHEQEFEALFIDRTGNEDLPLISLKDGDNTELAKFLYIDGQLIKSE
ncbi:MAG: hypothetical protein AB8G77_03170 [Rhodothermales bacterium]